MTETATELIVATASWLRAKGFRVAQQRKDDGFNQLLELSREPLRVRFICDRGLWSVAISVSGSRWNLPDAWKAYLSGASFSDEVPDVTEQLRILRDSLDDIAETAGDRPEAETEVSRLSNEDMRRRLET